MSSNGYGVVWPSFWTGSTGRQLRGDVTAQLVAVYLMTCSHKNSLGVFRCPPTYITTDTGIPLEGASEALRRLSEVEFLGIDATGETIWVFEMALYQIGERLEPKDNRVKSVHRLFAEIEDEQVQKAFFKKYGAAYQLPEPSPRLAKVSPFGGASKPQPSLSEANNYNYSKNYSSSVPSERTPAASIDPEKELFDRGKQVLGKSAGGLIAKLLKAKVGVVAKARAAIEQASTKQDPAEYIAAAIRGGAGPPAFAERQTNGFVALALERGYYEDEPDRSIIDITPNQPAGPGRTDGRPKLVGG